MIVKPATMALSQRETAVNEKKERASVVEESMKDSPVAIMNGISILLVIVRLVIVKINNMPAGGGEKKIWAVRPTSNVK